MSSIRTGIELQDNFSPVLNGIMASVSEAVSGMEQMQNVMDAGVDTSAITGAASDIDAATAAARELEEALQDIHAPVINLDQPAVPRTVEAPIRQEIPPQRLANPPPAMNADINTQSLVTDPDPITVPVTPEVAGMPQIDVPESITIPVTTTVEQPQLDVPDSITVPVITEVEQPQLDVPESITVSVAADVEQPEIDVPDLITVPVATLVEQPKIDVPDEVTVPVIAEVGEQEAITYDPITVPVVADVEQPQIDVPDPVTIPTKIEVEQPQINVPESITVPVTTTVEQPELDIPDEVTVPVVAEVDVPDVEIPEPQIPEPDLSGVEQYTNLINLAGAALQQVVSIQERINSQAAGMDVLPEDVQSKIGKVNTEIQQMQAALDFVQKNPFDLDAETAILQIDSLNASISQTLQEQKELNEQLQGMTAPSVEVPVQWQGDLEVFTSTGIERFNAEVQSANAELNTLNQTQRNIEQTASDTDILPEDAVQDITDLGQRLEWMTQKVQQIQNNRLNFGTDEANAGLEQIRSQLDAAIHAQSALNTALDNMDASAANAAYLQLSQTVGNTERFIRDNTNEQGQFNRSIQEGISQSDKLMNSIKGAVAAYASVQSIGKVLDMSDQLVMTTSRLDMMNDGVQSTADLVNMVYAAAQDSRGSFSDMADLVARFGNNAGDAFDSSEEVVAFADLIQKQMTIAGASTQEAANAELQLSQALGSGVLRGDELNSIFEQAPNLIQNIADYLDVPVGTIREMASEGQLSADVVKAAVFSASDEINAKFSEMPMTWGQIWQSMRNTAMIAFQPVLQKLNGIANSEAFQSFVSGAIESMATLANIVLAVFGLLGNVGSLIADNWSVISPIVYGVVGALAVYAAYLAVTEGMEIASAAASAIHTAAMSAKIGVTAALAGSTMEATAAQMGYNGALYACPIAWIIILIIALIAIIFAVCNAIADMTGVANSGFGIIAGGFRVLVAVIQNLAIGLINTIIGWVVNFHNMMANFAAAFGVLFNDPAAAVKATILSMFNFIVSVVSKAAAMLDAVFGSNLADAVSQFQGKIQAEIDATVEGAGGNAAQTLNPADYMLERVDYGDAFSAGVAWGDNIADKVANFSLSDIIGKTDIPNADDIASGFSDVIADSGIGNGINNLAGNTGAIRDSLGITQEDLEYLRDIAEQDAVNRYTTAEIRIEQTNNNTVNSGMDLDGVVSGLTSAVNEAVDEITEGVHD